MRHWQMEILYIFLSLLLPVSRLFLLASTLLILARKRVAWDPSELITPPHTRMRDERLMSENFFWLSARWIDAVRECRRSIN